MNNPSPKGEEEIYTPIIYPILKKTVLKKPVCSHEELFIDVLINRKTRRNFNLLSEDQLSTVLWYSAKAIEVQLQESGFIWSHRPSPSAGGRHPIDLIVSSPEPTTDRKLCLYNPIDHSLNELGLDHAKCRRFFNHINESLPIEKATVVWFVADQFRTESKYSHPLSLIWRDAGALLYALQLVCTESKIACCPLGTLGEPFISELFKAHSITPVFGIGGCIIG